MNHDSKPILVIGGGMAGMTAAVEAAEVGHRVILIEKEAYLGGRVLRMYRYFPKMCPPTCGFEVNVRRIRKNPRISVYTLATVKEISGEKGSYRAKIGIKPRYITGNFAPEKSALEKIETEIDNEFNYGMDKTKAVYLPHDMAYPQTYTVDLKALSENDFGVLKEIFPEGAVDFDSKEEEINLDVGAVVMATGWRPYDAIKLDNLGFGQFPNVITNVMMERLASSGGPTEGKILRPSDGQEATNVAFVQCAGSRDENHLPYCSAVCCMASLKQARFLREKNEKARVTVFYIDIRTIGRLEKFYYDMLEDENISFIKGKVAQVSEISESGNLTLDVEDTMTREKLHREFDLVVLATGMVPNQIDAQIPFDLHYDDYGFLDGSDEKLGIYAAGCAKHPYDVSHTTKDSTATALKAIQTVRGGE